MNLLNEISNRKVANRTHYFNAKTITSTNEYELSICKTQQPLEILVQFIKKNYGLQTVRLLLNRWFSSLISDCPKSGFRSEKVRTRKQSRR